MELTLPTIQKSIKSRDQHKVYKIGGDPDVGRKERIKTYLKKGLKF